MNNFIKDGAIRSSTGDRQTGSTKPRQAYTQIFTEGVEPIYRQWVKGNRDGTLRQFRIYLTAYRAAQKERI